MILSADKELHTPVWVLRCCCMYVPDAYTCSTFYTHNLCSFERADSFSALFFQSIFEGSSSLPGV